MFSTEIRNVYPLIFFYLRDEDLLTFRVVSKKAKEVIESTLRGQQISLVSIQSTKNLGNVTLKLKIKIADPHWLNADREEVRFIPQTMNQIGKIHLNPHSIGSVSILSLLPISKNNEVYWHKTKVAITRHSEEYDLQKTGGCTITVYNAETGDILKHLSHDDLHPLGWLSDDDHFLLMNKISSFIYTEDSFSKIQSNYYQCTYFSKWNFSDDTVDQIGCITGNIRDIKIRKDTVYFINCNNKVSKPFSNLDLATKKIKSLNYQVSEFETNKIHNFNVIAGNIFFSQNKSITILNGENSETIANFNSPLIPSEIVLRFPLIACYEKSRFIVYDIRKPHQTLYDHNYSTWIEQVSSYLSQTPTEIKSMALQGNHLFVGTKNNCLDHFDLATAPAWYSLNYWL